jgi:hypothetical protein
MNSLFSTFFSWSAPAPAPAPVHSAVEPEADAEEIPSDLGSGLQYPPCVVA